MVIRYLEWWGFKKKKTAEQIVIWISTNKNAAMNSRFLYHAWGSYHHKCLREEKGNTIILPIESK